MSETTMTVLEIEEVVGCRDCGAPAGKPCVDRMLPHRDRCEVALALKWAERLTAERAVPS